MNFVPISEYMFFSYTYLTLKTNKVDQIHHHYKLNLITLVIRQNLFSCCNPT